jgi:hypothetical protein
MQKLRIRLERGEMLEFTGELVSRLSRETVHDAHTRTIREYTLYRTEEGRYLLFLESRREIRSKRRFLKFETGEDVFEYVKRLENDPVVAKDVINIEPEEQK